MSENKSYTKTNLGGKRNLLKMTKLMVILLITLPLISSQNIKIDKIEQEIVVLQSKPIKLIQDYEILLHVINLTHCQKLISQLEGQVTQITKPNDLIREEVRTLKIKIETIVPHHIIHKRGWINIIGTGFKVVFGTLDDNDRQTIESKLDALEDNTKELDRIIINK